MTIRELAHLAGVSHTTVSRALRDHPRLSRETCESIQALARRHGYAPHPMVSELMSQLPQIRQIARSTLAIITRWSEWRKSNYMAALHRGVTERAAALGYQVEEFTLNSTEMTPERLSKVLYTRGIEGVLVYPFESVQPTIDLEWNRFCCVAIGRPFAEPHVHRVVSSYYENMRLALHELRALGYKRIALALTPVLLERVDDAYLAAYYLYERDLDPADRIPPFKAGHMLRPGYRAPRPGEHLIEHRDADFDPHELAAWLKEQRADCVITNFTPTLAEMRGAGLRIPEEIGYVTLDSIRATPEVSGIDQQPDRVGAAAVDLLTAHLHRHEHGVPASSKIMGLQSRWNPGASVRDQRPAKVPAKRRARAATSTA